MSWANRFRLRQYVRSSLWLLPLIGGVLGVVLGETDVLVDRSLSLPAALTYSATTATTILSAIVGAMAIVTGFVVGVSVAGLLVIVSVLVFLVFLDRCLHRLRPVAVIALVAGWVHQGLERDAEVLGAANDVSFGVVEPGDRRPVLVVHSHAAGAIQAIDYRGLARWAREHGQLVAVTHPMGDFVPAGTNLIEAYGGASADDEAERTLGGMIALGRERTIDQDPSFGIRIIVDVADHALSAAVNDPTTAVQALDHLGEILRQVGTLDFSRSAWTGDPTVDTGLVIRVRSWEDYLALATTEIREYGSMSITVMRRMRAMLEELREQVGPEHRPAVEDELVRLEASVLRAFGDSTDLDRAMTADPQGIGGRTGRGALSR